MTKKFTSFTLRTFFRMLPVWALFASFIALAQTNTWDGSASTDWNVAANWSLNRVPQITDNVVIPNVSRKPTVSSAGAVCASLNITNAGSGDNTLTINSPGTLVVQGAITITSPTNNNRSTIVHVASGLLDAASVSMTNSTADSRDAILRITTGTVNISGNIAMSGSANRNQVAFNGAGNLNIGGTIAGGGLTAGTGMVNYNNNGAQMVGAYTYYNLTTSGNGDKSLAGAITVRNLLVSTGTRLIDNDKQITGNASGSLTVENGAAIQLGGNDDRASVVATLFPTNFTKANIDLQAGSEVRYNYNGMRGAVQTISTVPDYDFLHCQYPGTKLVANGTLTVKGNFYTASPLNLGSAVINLDGDFNLLNVPAAITLSSSVFSIKGDYINDLSSGGSIVLNNGTVVFNGSQAQSIKGNGVIPTLFNNLTINNTSGGVSIGINGTNDEVTVSNTLTLANGILTTSPANLLNITRSAAGAITGGSTTSFINGPVKWSTSLNTTYNFPVGKGSIYLPLSLKTNATSGTSAQVEAFNSDSGGTANFTIPTVASTVGSLSNTEYWSLVTTGTYNSATISISRPDAISPLDLIAGSTAVNGTYTSLGGAPNTTGVDNSSAIGNNRFFTFGRKHGIRTGTVSASALCAGSQVSVPFTATGVYNSGNVFTAQLSNASGSFASPVNIGTLSATVAGTINATIPAGTPPGTGYRIRVISSIPNVVGSNNGINITINPNLPAGVSITASATAICAGTNVTFTANPTNGGTTPGYQWRVNGNNVGTSSATYSSSTLNNNDVVTVIMTSNASPCSTGSPVPSNPIIITVNPNLMASVNISANTTTICVGSSVTFTANPTNGGTTPAYQWRVNGTNVGTNSATYSSSALNDNDVVSVVMTSNASPCLTGSPAISNNITITVNPILPVTVTQSVFPTGADTCSRDYVQLTADHNAVFTPYTGLFSDAALTVAYTGEVVNTVYAAPDGAQTYTVTGVSGSCTSPASVSVTKLKKVFIGNEINANWDTDSNWFPTTAPLINQCAFIPSGRFVGVTSLGSAVARRITVENGGKLTIQPNADLTVSERLTNQDPSGDNVVIESDGNLMQLTNTTNQGSVTVKRAVDLSEARDQYNYLISPVIGQKMKYIFGTNGNGAPFIPFVLRLNEPTNVFVNDGDGNYVEGRGYSVKEPSKSYTGNTAIFKGIPVNGDITYPLSYTLNKGYNLSGNPYPSNLDIYELYHDSKVAGVSNIDSNIRFWDSKANNIFQQLGGSYQGYAYAFFNAETGSHGTGTAAPGGNGKPATGLTPNHIVKVGQGFMVRAKNTEAKLMFSNGPQRISEQSGSVFFGKSAKLQEDDRFWLEYYAPSGTVISNAIVYFNGGTNDFSSDDTRIPNSSVSDALFTFAGDAKVIINGRSPFAITDVLTLGTRHFTAGTYKIKVGERQGRFRNGQVIYLKDKKLGIVTDLTNGEYTFTSEAGEFTNRFEIIYEEGKILASGNSEKSQIKVFLDETDFVVKSSVKSIEIVDVYDASGRLILNAKGIAKELRLDSTELTEGMYVLKIQLKGGEVFTTKIKK